MALEAVINGDKQKKTKKRGRTLRFELELAPPTEESTNEFSYTDLVVGEQRKGEGCPQLGDMLEKGPTNQLTDLAQRLEEKYGAPSPKRRKLRIFESDLIDRGRGYDTNDSFVDDSEMYEDFVPPQVDTKFGGFYVNTGELEFKRTWQAKEEEDTDILIKKKKPKMKKQASHQTPQSILASQKLKKAKQHVAAAQKVPKPKANKVLFKMATSVTSSPAALLGKVQALHKKTTSVGIKKKGGISLPIMTAAMVGGEGEGELGKKDGEESENIKPPPVLPEDLPADIMTSITQFEESVARDQANTPDGKISVKMRCSYDQQLTELELACRKLHMKKRVAVLEYVSHKLGVSRATTTKRIRQVMKKREEEALAQPLQRLKAAVDASMPEHLQLYEQELKVRADSLSSGGDKLPVTHTEVEDDDEVFDESSNTAMEMKETAAKVKRPPRKKYKWNEETRRLLCEAVKVKVESEEKMRGRSNGEEIVMEFLDTKVKPLWPKGWMQKSILYKATEPVHRHFTNPQSKKVVPSAKRSVDLKRESPDVLSASSSAIISHAAPVRKKPEPREPSPHHLQLADSSTASSPKVKEIMESVQWAVRSSAGDGSPLTIVRKTVTPAAVSGTSSSSGLESVKTMQITPRMAQLLSSVASSQALVKTPKVASGTSEKTSSLSATLPAKKSDQHSRVSLHSDVHALISQFQSKSPPSVIVASGNHPPKLSPSLTQSATGSRRVTDGTGVRGTLTNPKGKITTSSIQMKAIVSQLKPKVASQSKLTATPTHKQTSSSSHALIATSVSSIQPHLSVSSVVPPSSAMSTKVKNLAMVGSTGPALKLYKTVSSAPSRTTGKPIVSTSVERFPTASLVQSPTVVQTHTKRVSPPSSKATGHESHTNPRPTATSTKRSDHSGVVRIRSSPPLLNSHSSPPQASLLPTSSPIIHQVSPVLSPLPPPPPPATGGRRPSLVATSALSASSLYPTTAVEGVPVTPVLLQQQPATYAVTSGHMPQTVTLQQANSVKSAPPQSDSLAQIAVTTIPFSSCASTLVLTSPLSHLPRHMPPILSPYQTLPPHSLAISPPTDSSAGSQVPIARVSGTGVKSPLEQISQEHSYGGKSTGCEP